MLLIGLLITVAAEAQLFRAGIVAGANFTQIDGDDYAGYHKVGINAGFLTDIEIGRNFSTSLEILYSPKGSASTLKPNSYSGSFKLQFDYVSIPILLNYNDRNKMIFGAGFTFNRLVNSKYIVDGEEFPQILEQHPARNWDYGFVGSLTLMLNPSFGINLRSSYSLYYFRQAPESNLHNFAQYHNTVTLRLLFFFRALGERGETL